MERNIALRWDKRALRQRVSDTDARSLALTAFSLGVRTTKQRVMKFQKHTLPNGLEIVAECNDAAYSTALGFFVNTGSYDKSDAVAGVSELIDGLSSRSINAYLAAHPPKDFTVVTLGSRELEVS
jgi:predicted Zn-dependent peptidase